MTFIQTEQLQVLPLWPDGAPGSEHWTHQEQETPPTPPFNVTVLRNITQPALAVHLPDPALATGTGVIVCPGGGFQMLAIEHEGTDLAHWLTARGVAAFVLKYRLFPTSPSDEEFARQMEEAFRRNPAEDTTMDEVRRQILPLAVADGKRAMELVRDRAAEWALAPDRIGMIGFSAGARLTVGLTLNSGEKSRPSFVGAIYGAMWEDITAPENAPPLFIALASNDPLHVVRPCLTLYQAWWSAGHSAEMHIYAQGSHGFGMRKQGLPIDTWIERFGDWLNVQGLLTPRPLVAGKR
jgi:acetyl esterase/lipase